MESPLTKLSGDAAVLACWSCCRGDVTFVIAETGEVIDFDHVQK